MNLVAPNLLVSARLFIGSMGVVQIVTTHCIMIYKSHAEYPLHADYYYLHANKAIHHSLCRNIH